MSPFWPGCGSNPGHTMETLTMSRKERDRMTIMTGVKRQELTLVQAGKPMAVCYRQSKRIWRRYQDDGDAGLVHRLRGKPSVRRKPPELRAQALARLCPGTLRRHRADADGGSLREGKAGGGSRDVAALADGGRQTHGAAPEATAPAMAGTQAEL